MKIGIQYTLFIFLALLLWDVQPGFAQRAVISLNHVKIYSLPMVDANPVAILTKGENVRVIGKRGAWVKIETADGHKGWMQLQVPKKTSSGKERRKPATTADIPKGTQNTYESASNTADANRGGSSAADMRRKPKPHPPFGPRDYRRFGYSFGMGLLELDFTYNWKFIFHTTQRLALVGSFKHTLGDAADSYFILANLSYLLKEDNSRFMPFVTAGMGVINTVPKRSIGTDGVSNMTINYGIGARKYFRKNLSFLFNVTQYTAFVGKGINNFREFTMGLLVGKFWD